MCHYYLSQYVVSCYFCLAECKRYRPLSCCHHLVLFPESVKQFVLHTKIITVDYAFQWEFVFFFLKSIQKGESLKQISGHSLMYRKKHMNASTHCAKLYQAMFPSSLGLITF